MTKVSQIWDLIESWSFSEDVKYIGEDEDNNNDNKDNNNNKCNSAL